MKGTPRRKSIRFQGFDYTSGGAYFVTLVTKNRECLFGEIIKDEMVLSEYGKVVAEEWERSPFIRNEIELGAYVVMPNHFHGIVHIFQNDCHTDDNRRGDRPVAPTNTSTRPHGPRPKSLGSLIGGFKSAVTTRINALRGTPGTPVWQRNFHDHIIRDDPEYAILEQYIQDNPLRWAADKENR